MQGALTLTLTGRLSALASAALALALAQLATLAARRSRSRSQALALTLALTLGQLKRGGKHTRRRGDHRVRAAAVAVHRHARHALQQLRTGVAREELPVVGGLDGGGVLCVGSGLGL